MHVGLCLCVCKRGHVTLGRAGEVSRHLRAVPEWDLLRKLQLCAPPKATDSAPEVSVPLISLVTGFTCEDEEVKQG